MSGNGEEYVEYGGGEEYYEDDAGDFTLGDAAFLLFFAVLVCGVLAFVMRHVRKTFSDVSVKVGDKINVGVKTRGEE